MQVVMFMIATAPTLRLNYYRTRIVIYVIEVSFFTWFWPSNGAVLVNVVVSVTMSRQQCRSILPHVKT